MNKSLIRLILFACFLCLTSQVLAQTSVRNLPKGATIVETRALPATAHANRTLVLWMVNPKKNPNQTAADEIYTCPEQTRGSYYSGPLRVSLVSNTGAVINTVNVSEAYEDGNDSFDVPYLIRKGYYYRVPANVKRGIEAKPNLIWLRDYNGDGTAMEFALFDAPACMGLQTTLIGYSVKQDRVIQYQISLEVLEGANRSHIVTRWADYLFAKKPDQPGHWKYEIDYTGRGGTRDTWEIRYNAAREQFEGTLTQVSGE